MNAAHSEISREASKRALKIRIESGYELNRPCDVYELIARQRTELQFIAVPTLEGMYLEDRGNKRVCVSSFRPRGRQRFTAAHECGHQFLGHGTKLDQIERLRDQAQDRDREEQMADTFATALLMPSGAVSFGFTRRGFSPTKPSPAQIHGVATWLGVGYTTLCKHLCYSMHLISVQQLAPLLRTEPKSIKSGLIGRDTTSEVFELDALWRNERVHCEVGDYLMDIASFPETLLADTGNGLLTAVAPGHGTVGLTTGGSTEISVARKNYVGFYEYRYLPEED